MIRGAFDRIFGVMHALLQSKHAGQSKESECTRHSRIQEPEFSLSFIFFVTLLLMFYLVRHMIGKKQFYSKGGSDCDI